MDLIRNIEVVHGGSAAGDILTKATEYFQPVNAQDCDGVLFILASNSSEKLAAAASSMVLRVDCASATDATFKVYGTSENKLSATNRTCGVAYSTGSASCLILDIPNPKVKWLKPCVHGATGRGTILAIKYGMRNAGATHLNQFGGSTVWGNIGVIAQSTKST